MMDYLRKHRPYFRALLFYGAAFFGGGLIGLWLGGMYIQPPCSTNFKFISQDIACGKKTIIDKTNYIGLRDDLISYIGTQKNNGTVTDVAIYFRDLNDGPVFDVNGGDDFSPASLLKLPLTFAFFDVEENGTPIINQLVKYTEMPETDAQTFAPAISIKPNQPYSVETLLSNILMYSDNISYQILIEYLNGQPGGSAEILQTFRNLGIIDPQSDVDNTISVRGYSSLFRLLYNASYLNNADSEKILSWLSRSDFTVGLVAGVPKGTVVAHKFGEREIGGPSPVSQLHDCGIIYYPGNPYSLCVMTRGVDIRKLPAVIAAISNMVYAEVDSRKL